MGKTEFYTETQKPTVYLKRYNFAEGKNPPTEIK